MRNTLYYGDNLAILREYIPSESVDLVYLDPPFNSNRSYNVLFKHEGGSEAQAQVQAFDDTWHWNEHTEATFAELVTRGRPEVGAMIAALREFIGENQMMAYLVMMAVRLVELHRVLKPTGSLYLHCDPTASHYLKVVIDTIWGPKNFRNELVWRRTGSHNKVRRYGPVHDSILFYTKTDSFTWTNPKRRYMRGHIEEYFVQDEHGYRTDYYGNVLTGSGTRNGESGEPWKGFNPTAKGRHWAIPGALLDDIDEDLSSLGQHQKLDRLFELGHIKIVEGQAWPMYARYLKPTDGQPLSDIWAYQPYTEGTVFGTEEGIDADVRWLSTKDQERLGYPTQKPVALLERILQASSNPGDVVLDPFCGCGTTIAAAQKLGRTWLGIDITHLAIALQKFRLKTAFGLVDRQDYDVIGEPADLAGAQQLALDDRYQFQWWALSLIQAQPLGGDGESKQGKKGADKGIDGVITFIDDATGKPKRVIVQVKSGHVSSATVRDLRGVVEREKAAIGVLITLEPPSGPMNVEAAKAGVYQSFHWGEFPRVQILTVGGLLHGYERLRMPPQGQTSVTFKKAQREEDAKPKQPGLGLE